MLKGRGDRVCFACHADAESRFLKAYTHKPVLDGNCGACHPAHASDEPKLLRATGAKLCQGCHGEPHEAGAGRAARSHKPFVDGDCLKCHDPHGSNVKGHAPGGPEGDLPEVPRQAGPGGGQGQERPRRLRPRELHRVPQPAQGGAQGAAPGPGAGRLLLLPRRPQEAEQEREGPPARRGLPRLPRAARRGRSPPPASSRSSTCAGSATTSRPPASARPTSASRPRTWTA